MPKDKKGFATKISKNHLRAHLQGLCPGVGRVDAICLLTGSLPGGGGLKLPPELGLLVDRSRLNSGHWQR